MKRQATPGDKKIALIAGALQLPFFTRDALRRAGWDVYVVGLKNFVDPKLEPDLVVRLGGAGRAFREFRRRGIKNLTFVGAIGHRVAVLWLGRGRLVFPCFLAFF